ncbi:hypothetical protein DSO57_1023357 [Entomophthora muscae]|uniref:Uncharacterized protein n=1 Tax=Entomophthora muscae TaxID=34485 RepID=A0ACC2S5D1_9FUNG|nr:hypothetical protein DSO57_1023357 [Entomophthora muscae]
MSHVMPLLEVGSVLAGRKHAVIYAAADFHAKYNGPYGFDFRSLGATFDDAGFIRDAMKRVFGQRMRVDGNDIFATFNKILPISYEAVYPRLSALVEQEKPDVMVCEFFSPACRDVAEMNGIPLVMSFQSTDGFSLSRAAFVTNTLGYIPITTDKLGFVERFHDKVVVPLISIYKFYGLTRALNKKRALFNVPAASQPLGDFSNVLGLANSFVGFEAAAPLPLNLRMVGPLENKLGNHISPELQSFLDSHSRTLYVGFGSRVVLANFDVENIVIASLIALKDGIVDGVVWGLGSTRQDDFPETILFEGNLLPREYLFQHPNMRVLAWAPQDAVLKHPNTKLFLSHGGLGSLFEAIFAATPVLCMPFFSDQPRNARKLEDAGIGQYVDRITATPHSLVYQMDGILQDRNGSIAMNLRRMQMLARIGSRRRELGADAVEEYAYTAQFCRPIEKHVYGQITCEAKHLIPASQGMSYIQANLIDVYLVAWSLMIGIAFILLLGGLKLFFYLKASQKTTKKKTH